MTSSPSQAPSLQCFGGPPIPAVVAGWAELTRFTHEARRDFWAILEPALLNPTRTRPDELFEPLCAKHELPAGQVLSAAVACDLLLGRAAAHNLDRAAFRADLEKLSGDGGAAHAADLLLGNYETIKARIRAAIVQTAMTDHGNVLVGLSWRLDRMEASDRGGQLETNVVWLTLRYQRGSEQEQITLQLAPQALRELKGFTDRFAGG